MLCCVTSAGCSAPIHVSEVAALHPIEGIANAAQIPRQALDIEINSQINTGYRCGSEWLERKRGREREGLAAQGSSAASPIWWHGFPFRLVERETAFRLPTKKAVPGDFVGHRFVSVAPPDRFERSTPALGELCSVP